MTKIACNNHHWSIRDLPIVLVQSWRDKNGGGTQKKKALVFDLFQQRRAVQKCNICYLPNWRTVLSYFPIFPQYEMLLSFYKFDSTKSRLTEHTFCNCFLKKNVLVKNCFHALLKI